MTKHDSQTGSITDESASTGGILDRRGSGDVDRDSHAGDGGSVTPSEPMPTAHKIDRRTFVKGLGVAGAAGVGLSGRSPGPAAVGDAEAIAPIVVAGGAVALGWALREFEVVGSDSVTDGLGPDALHQNTYQIVKTRESTNASTIVDNGNILDGVKNTAYTDAKVVAIEKLNQELSLSEVKGPALDEAKAYLTTVQKNFLKSWNESVNELDSLSNSVEASSTSHTSIFIGKDDEVDSGYKPESVTPGTETVTLADGTDFTVKNFEVNHHLGGVSSGFNTWSPLGTNELDGSWNEPLWIGVSDPDGSDDAKYLYSDVWQSLWSDMVAVESEVLGGLETWVDNVYSSVQTGDIEVSELITPRERAAMLSDDEEYPQAVADLIALNIPVDPDREATITLQDRDITLSGLMAPTSPPADGFVVGQTYDPTAAPWDLYFTYDPSKGSGGWTDVETQISEGTLVFTSEPYESSLYRVPTNAGTVEVTSSDFTESDSGGTWTADVSGQLERVETEWTDFEAAIDGGTVTFTALPSEPAEFDITATDGDSETVTGSEFTDNGDGTYSVETGLGISEVDTVKSRIDRWNVTDGESVSVFSEDGSTGYETIQIKEPFTLDKLEDSEGNTYGQSEFSQTEPQTDSNYITQEEWDSLEQQNQELIDKYEESTKSNDGLLGGGGWGDIVPGGGAGALAVGVAVSVGAIAVLREGIKFYLPGR